MSARCYPCGLDFPTAIDLVQHVQEVQHGEIAWVFDAENEEDK